MEDTLVPIIAIGSIFIGLPWLLFHYVTQWKRSGSLSIEDERLLDELHDLARRLDERMHTIERIVADEHPGFRPAAPSSDRPRGSGFEHPAGRQREY